MRKTLTAFAVAAIFTACTGKPKTGTDSAMAAMGDTASMDQNSGAENSSDFSMNGVSDTIVSGDGSRFVKVDPNAVVEKPVAVSKARTASAPARKTTTRTTTRKSTTGSGSGGTTASTTGTGTESNTGTVSTTPPVEEKKGWSNSAKGAVIGAGTGAAAGAIIGKNKVKGAIVGGVLGAGGGFVIGKIRDKKAAKDTVIRH